MTTPLLQFRRVQSSDATALQPLCGQLGYPCTATELTERIRYLLQSPLDEVVVALSDSQPVGWIHVFVTMRLESGQFAEIGGLVVYSTFQGQGIGRRLVEEAQRWAKGRTTLLRVRSRQERTGAHQFYQRMGFRPSKEQMVFDLPL